MKEIRVNLAGGRGYPVLVGAGALMRAAHFAPNHCAIISNQTIAQKTAPFLQQLQDALSAAGKRHFILQLPDGETHKNLHSLGVLIDGLTANGLGRDGGIIALGGGVIGDVAGFAAAVYMRGIALVQIPTTLLSMVDAAIGGKTGVNHASGKNLIGAFWQPRAVLADPGVLATLPEAEYTSGLAEVIKYGLLGDAEFFAELEKEPAIAALRARESDELQWIISKSARAKADIVAADETEQSGRRELLNLGHTFAHAFETTLGYGVWRHGQAVACGMVAAALLSENICNFPAGHTRRISRLLEDLSLPACLPPEADIDTILAAMQLDKKNAGGKKRFILMRAIGDAYAGESDDASVRDVLYALKFRGSLK